ncbi:MAG TPA: glycosyltransferase family 9 protein [Anaeromyxobacteraceae bacterium]|nr:glycosyltransferase family 9 protein [Anaeromyxobacteraceae bacterium]
MSTRVLVVRYSALGDVVLATSILAPLRERFPGAHVEWVTDALYAPLLQGLPNVAAVHAIRRGEAGNSAQLRRELGGRFDVAIDLQNKVRTALIVRSAAPRRITFRRRTPWQAISSAFGYDPPLNRTHATQLYADALRPLGVGGPGPLEISLSGEARARAGELLAGVRSPVVALAPGARWPTKRWSPQRFAEVADVLAADGASIVLAGGPGDRDAFSQLRAALRAPVAADLSSLSIDALAAALARVDLLVSNDSGPVHLASAVGTPVLALYGPTSSIRWGPRAPGRALSLALPCAPCSNHGGDRCPAGHHRCMKDLAPAAVIAAAREMLS